MTSVLDNNLLVEMKIEPQISYLIIINFTN